MPKTKRNELDGLGLVLTVMIGMFYLPIKILFIFFKIMISGTTIIIRSVINLTYYLNNKKTNKNSTGYNNLKTTKTIKQEYNQINQNKKNDKIDNLLDSETEKEMDALELEDWQKELVRSGEFYTTAFEEEDMDEDSYFYDDF